MSPDQARAVDQVLGDLPLDDRLVALVVSIITRKPQAIPAVLSMIAATAAMTRGLSHNNRVMIAELLRDCADHVERRQEVVRID